MTTTIATGRARCSIRAFVNVRVITYNNQTVRLVQADEIETQHPLRERQLKRRSMITTRRARSLEAFTNFKSEE